MRVLHACSVCEDRTELDRLFNEVMFRTFKMIDVSMPGPREVCKSIMDEMKELLEAVSYLRDGHPGGVSWLMSKQILDPKVSCCFLSPSYDSSFPEMHTFRLPLLIIMLMSWTLDPGLRLSCLGDQLELSLAIRILKRSIPWPANVLFEHVSNAKEEDFACMIRNATRLTRSLVRLAHDVEDDLDLPLRLGGECEFLWERRWALLCVIRPPCFSLLFLVSFSWVSVLCHTSSSVYGCEWKGVSCAAVVMTNAYMPSPLPVHCASDGTGG